jgi:hypothetical protein
MKMEISSSKEKELQNLSKLIDKKIEFLINKMATPSLFGDFEGRSTSAKPSNEPYPSTETLKLVEAFEETIELIRQGEYPNWTDFFTVARKLNEDYFIEHGQSTSLADELMSVYEIDVKDVYSDQSFLTEIINILPEEIHFLCFLLNGEYSEKIDGEIIDKIWNQISNLENPVSCYECGSNRWWGNPVAYVAQMEKLSSENLKKIYDFTSSLDDRFEYDIEIIYSALASNKSTPISVLQFLATVNKEPIMASNDQYPFYDENGVTISNISELAKFTIANLKKE